VARSSRRDPGGPADAVGDLDGVVVDDEQRGARSQGTLAARCGAPRRSGGIAELAAALSRATQARKP
jgi:hypothetical protein